MYKRFIATLFGLFLAIPLLWAQSSPLEVEGYAKDFGLYDSLPLPKWEPHLSVGTGFISSYHGDSRMYSTVAPSLVYRPNDKLTVTGGFRITTDLSFNPSYHVGAPRSLAPRRHNGSTGLVSAELGAQYRLGENVWLAAALYHLGGQYVPMYGFASGQTLEMSATAIAASAAFRFNNDNYLHLYVAFIRDNAGTLPHLMYDTFCSGWGGYGGYGWSYYDYYRMMSPGAMGFSGWYY